MSLHYISIDGVLDNINNLIDHGFLQTVSTRNTNLPGQKPADGHGLTKPLSIPSETRKLTPRKCWLHGNPVVHIVPWRSYPLVCIPGRGKMKYCKSLPKLYLSPPYANRSLAGSPLTFKSKYVNFISLAICIY